MARDPALFPIPGLPVLEDRPIHSEAEDKLDRSSFVAGIIRALVSDERDENDELISRRSTNYVVGLTGPWGSGKSSIINLLSLKLGTMDRVLVTTLNPWLFNGRNELLTAFFSALRSALGKSRREELRGAIGALDRYQEAIGIAAQVAAAYADVHGAGGKATSIVRKGREQFRKLLKRQRELSPEDERLSLERKIASSKQAIVVLIDELDRVEDTEVKAVAQLVKAVGDIRGISYLVAYDPQRVIDALGRGSADERIRTGEAYLEKIIQHPIPLRPLLEEDVRVFLDLCLTAEGLDWPDVGDDNGKQILDAVVRSIQTPREVKRLIGAYAIINRMTREELYPYDVLAYCWIITKTSTLRQVIVDNIHRVVEDPPDDEDLIAEILADGDAKSRSPESILGQAAKSQDRLLRLIFPNLTKDSSKQRRGDRISRTRNLIRLLYLGDPPGSVTRFDIHDVLEQGQPGATAAFKAMLQGGNLGTFLDRIDDTTDSLPDQESDSFWLALAGSLVRDHDWLTRAEAERNLSDDAQEMLLRLGLRGRTGRARAQHIVQALISSGDLVIVPGFLRRHMFQHGLVVGESARGGRSALNESETASLLGRELPRYREAVLSGYALRRLPNVEAVFVISNSGAWDEKLRVSLTEQLNSPEAIQTVAALLVSPGWVISKKALDELMDSDVVLSRLNTFYEQRRFSEDPWIKASIARFRATLRGGDPTFITGDEET